MCNEQQHRRGFAIVSLLTACAKKHDLAQGKRLHAEVIRNGLLETAPYLASALINMYAKCGFLGEAQDVIDELCDPDIAAWNALISGYAHQDHGLQAIDCFKRMKCEGFSPDVVTFTCALKACGKTRDLDGGQGIHEEILSRDLLRDDVVLGTALVDMYMKCGMLLSAQMVFDHLPVRNAVTWNSLIAGYALHDRFHEALACFEKMQKEGFSPDAATFISASKACGSLAGGIGIERGERIHDEVVRRGLLEQDVVLGSAMVDMYARCGMLGKAEQVLDQIPTRNIFSWSSVIQGYVEMDRGEDALSCFGRMRSEGLSPDAIAFVCVIKACSKTGNLETGEQIHAEIARRGLLPKDATLGNALVDMYAKCGALTRAKQMLAELAVRDLVSWNSLITGYALQGRIEDALLLVEMMQSEGISPDAITYISVLKECGSMQAIEIGMRLHGDIVDMGLLQKEDVSLGNALVDMYSKWGMLAKAWQVLEALPDRDVITWNTLITGFTRQGEGHRAFACLKGMQSEGLSPDATTYVCMLQSFGSIGAVAEGIRIHEEISRSALLHREVMCGNALIDMYAKCGVLSRAEEVLEGLHARDVVSWNTLIAGYCYHGRCCDAWSALVRMQDNGFAPDPVTFVCVLNACADMGAVEKGRQIHSWIRTEGLLENHVAIGNALVDMYAKCGMLEKASAALEELPARDVVSWNALIGGYTQQGRAHEALECERRMRCDGISPDGVTFVCILSACNRAGLSDTAHMYFRAMAESYGMAPSSEHHTCMVASYVYAGQFAEAMSVIELMPSCDYPPVWIALLSGCRKWGNVELGRFAFHRVIQSDDDLGRAYMLMAGIFAAAGMDDDAREVEAMKHRYAR